MHDDPESRFRRFPALLKRWTWRSFSRRLRLPLRQRRWDAENRKVTKPYRRAPSVNSPNKDEREIIYAVGDFSGQTGLSRAAQYELTRLQAEFSHLTVIDLAASIHERKPVIEEDGPPVDRLYLLSAPDTYATLFQAFPPARLHHTYRVGLWVWETPIFPEHWRFAIDLVDEIWTPSEYSRRALASTVTPRPVIVRSHAVDVSPAPAGMGDDLRTRFGVAKTAFMGLAIMDIRSCPARKNPWAHVAAWQRAFGDDPDSVLLLKVRVSKTTNVVRQELTQMIGPAKNIRVIEAELTDEEITALQESTDVYLSLHRAEGYGLNIHECLALGTPTVATDFSANAEYGPQFANYFAMPYRLVPYRDWTKHYSDGPFKWAEVNLNDCSEMLQKLRSYHEASNLNLPRPDTREKSGI